MPASKKIQRDLLQKSCGDGPDSARSFGMLPADVKELAYDPEWESIEEQITAHTNRNIPQFEALYDNTRLGHN